MLLPWKSSHTLFSLCRQCRVKTTLQQQLLRRQPPSLRCLTTSQRRFEDATTTPEPTLDSLSPSRNPPIISRQASELLQGLSGLSVASSSKGGSLSYKPPPKPHHLHIYATRHNCHITLSTGARDAVISVSAGNLNFRKAARGSYDAGFQLGAFFMAKIKNMGLLDDRYPGKGGPIRALEIVLRDFGPGREAVLKILMGQEGKELRQKVTRIMDASRLKFGGTRSKKPRRLG